MSPTRREGLAERVAEDALGGADLVLPARDEDEAPRGRGARQRGGIEEEVRAERDEGVEGRVGVGEDEPLCALPAIGKRSGKETSVAGPRWPCMKYVRRGRTPGSVMPSVVSQKDFRSASVRRKSASRFASAKSRRAEALGEEARGGAAAVVGVLAAEDPVEGLAEDVVAVVSVVVVGTRVAVVEEAVDELLGAPAGRDAGEAAPLRPEEVAREGGDEPEEARLAGGVPEGLDGRLDVVLGDLHGLHLEELFGERVDGARRPAAPVATDGEGVDGEVQVETGRFLRGERRLVVVLGHDLDVRSDRSLPSGRSYSIWRSG